MRPLVVVYFIYLFVAFYLLVLYVLTYMQNKKQIFLAPKPDKVRDLSIVVPCYNEEDSIGKNIESLLKSDYKGLKKIIVVDDCSKDNSYKVIKKYAQKYKKVIALQTPKNTGCAAGAKNYGAKFAKTELIGFSDADSFPRKDAIDNMVGFFNDKKVGVVTSRVLVKNKKNKLTKIQSIEYKIIAFTRKILEFLDSVYVANGPLSIYRKDAFDKTGFNQQNLTEDIELTWNLVSKGYKVKMAMSSIVYTIVPEKFKVWYKQRLRWDVGGLQTVHTYIKKITSCGMLGTFIIPLFISAWFLGLTGLIILIYRITQYIFLRYLSVQSSIAANISVFTVEEFTLNPTLLFFFGVILIALGSAYTLTGLFYSREKERTGISDIFIYSIFYLLTRPFVLIASFIKWIRRSRSW